MLRGAGSWDVLAWRGRDFLFLESKQYRSSDRLNNNQRAWLEEAAIHVGESPTSFVIVEYDAGPASSLQQRSAQPQNAESDLPPGLSPKSSSPLDPRIRRRRDRIPRQDCGVRARTRLGQSREWLADDRMRRFAIVVFGRYRDRGRDRAGTAQSVCSHGRPLTRYLARSTASRVTPGTRPTASPRTAQSNVYMASGRPPRSQGGCEILNRDGSACHNPGRHSVGSKWSCTTHYKALSRQGLSG